MGHDVNEEVAIATKEITLSMIGFCMGGYNDSLGSFFSYQVFHPEYEGNAPLESMYKFRYKFLAPSLKKGLLLPKNESRELSHLLAIYYCLRKLKATYPMDYKKYYTGVYITEPIMNKNINDDLLPLKDSILEIVDKGNVVFTLLPVNEMVNFIDHRSIQ